jgi:hypothetical protein
MEASNGSEDGERRERRTGVVLGVLATLVLGLGIALGVVLTSDDGGGSDDPDVTAATSATQATVTVTEPPGQTTATTPAEPTITQQQAKAAAARAASEEAAKGGITIPPGDWDVRCTALAGAPSASRWTCQAASSGGQCSGTVVAFASRPGVALTAEPRIVCGE